MKKIKTSRDLERLFLQIKKNADRTTGSYIFKEYRIQISKFKEDVSDRVLRLYHKRRNQGLCIICKKKVKEINIKTKKPYRHCRKHRLEFLNKK